MRFNLAQLARRNGIRRDLTFRPIEPTKANAQGLAMLYLAVVKAWSPERILAGYSLPAQDSLTTDAASDQANAIERAADEVTRLIAEFKAGLRGWILRTERIHRSKWAEIVKAATGVDLGMMLTAGEVQETLDTFMERNVALVRDISEEARGRISDAVFRGYQERRTAREVAKDIREATGMARDRALRVASHQNAVLSGALDQQRQAEAGITAWRWRSSHKKHPRSWHAKRDGNIYDAKTRKQLNPDTTVMAGGETIEAGDEPSQPPFCGCRAAAYLPLMHTLGI